MGSKAGTSGIGMDQAGQVKKIASRIREERHRSTHRLCSAVLAQGSGRSLQRRYASSSASGMIGLTGNGAGAAGAQRISPLRSFASHFLMSAARRIGVSVSAR